MEGMPTEWRGVSAGHEENGATDSPWTSNPSTFSDTSVSVLDLREERSSVGSSVKFGLRCIPHAGLAITVEGDPINGKPPSGNRALAE